MNDITVRFATKTILLKSKFAKKAAYIGTQEAATLQKVLRDYPDYEIVIHQINKKDTQEHYKGLTYDYMRRYINNHEDAESKKTVLNELAHKIEISKCHSDGYRYSEIKKWFLDMYPEIKNWGMPQVENFDEGELKVA